MFFKKIFIPAILFIIASGISFSQNNLNQEIEKIKSTQPAPEHNILLNFVGKYRVLISLFADQGAPQYGKGESINKILMDGRYIEFETAIEMDSYPLIYKYIIGYDNIRKMYSLYSIDNVSTNQLISYGKLDRKARTITFNGQFQNMIDKSMNSFSIVFSLVSDSKFEIDLFIGDEKNKFHRSKTKYILIDR